MTSPTPLAPLGQANQDCCPAPACYATASFAAFTGRALIDLPSGLGLEGRWLLGEWIDALACLRGGLLDDNKLREAGYEEHSRFLEFLVANFGDRLDDGLNVLPRHAVSMLFSDFLNEFRLRHHLGHLPLLTSESPCDHHDLAWHTVISAATTTMVLGLRCSWCPRSAPMPLPARAMMAKEEARMPDDDDE
jgi:hypothetical protein